VEDLEESEASEPPPSPELLARRSGLRKLVGATVAGVAALAVVALAIGAFGGGNEPVAVEAVPVAGPGELAAHGAASPRPDGALAVESTPRKDSPAAEASPTAGIGAAPAEDPSELRTEAVQLLQSRKLAEAAQVARKLIAAEPDHAFGYRCLGAALQDQGKWSEALEIYGACAKHAQRGEVGECVALGGRR
jgi:tetratricopeptide (TPR) repeat protein